MRRLSANRFIVLLGGILLLCVAQGSAASTAGRPMQAQGSSPYCLFAVNAYLAGGDMWRLEAEYHRRNLPTADGVTPYNGAVMKLAGELYGARWQTPKQGDWEAARRAVLAGKPTAFTGRGHAIVVLDFDAGRAFYLDSLNPGTVQSMSEKALRQWWDGWAWYNEQL